MNFGAFFMTGIEKKKSFIINTVYVAIVIALFYLFFKYALGTVFPIICRVLYLLLYVYATMSELSLPAKYAQISIA